ncbi:Vipas39 [Columba guinea]|nr:Vipas39 [Columba guinea]
MSRARADEEEYWHSSKFRAFTFDDEDDELSQLKESKRAVNSLRDIVDDDDDDDLERVSWSGEPVGSISWSIKETASSSNSSLEGRDSSLQKGSSSYAALPKQVSSYSLSSLFKGRNKLPSFQSLSDALSDTGVKNYAPELRRPKAEYKDYSSDWSPKDTVRRMQRGKVCSLERFRSLQDKLVLLDEAVAGNDGNVITAWVAEFSSELCLQRPFAKASTGLDQFAVCLDSGEGWSGQLRTAFLCSQVLIFLKRTLRREILFRELEVRQVALCHLIHFLKESGEQKMLLDLLRFLDRTEEVALSQYREHLNIQDVEKRREFLKGCIGLPFSAEDTSHIQDHYTLLERQIIIEANDRRLEAAGQSEIFQKYPRKASILNMPLVTTLFYSCFYHYTEAEGTFSSPTNLKKTFKIPDKQYVLTALAARAKLRAWDDVDALFTTKNWLGYTKKKAPIGFHRVVEILQRNSAPVQVLQEYVRLVEDVETRLNLATKYKCHDVVIETYRDLKDRIQLTAYKCKVERGSADEEKINSILNNMGLGVVNLAPEESVFSTDVSHVSFSLLANPMEELSTWEAACLAFALPVKEETAKPSPVPAEQLLLLIA